MNELLDFDTPNSLKEKGIIVAGGSGGLGSVTAAWLAREGAHLVVGYRSNRVRAEQLQATLQETFGTKVALVGGDLAAGAVREEYLDKARSMPEGLYGLACFTGDPARVDFSKADTDDLIPSLTDNYTGPLLLARDSGEEMRRTGVSGSIVLLSTMQAVALFPGSFNYAGPKVALTHAARILAKQWGGKSEIRVNAVAPGVNRAGMALASIESGKYDRFVDDGIVSRFGRARDVARAVRFLLEPDNYVTGQIITVDGGLTLRG